MLDIGDLADHIKAVIASPTERDKQVKIGPSGLGSECAYCIAATMATQLHGTPPPSNSFSLYPWVGTAVHHYLDHLLSNDDRFVFRTETSAVVGEIKGHHGNPDYGIIKGNIDLYSEEHRAVIDFKILGANNRRKYKRQGLSTQYAYQAQLYGLGIEKLGLPIEQVGVLMIPRDSAKLSDITLIYSPYDRAKAEAALTRAETIWNDFVIPNTYQELETWEDCFNVHPHEEYNIKFPV